MDTAWTLRALPGSLAREDGTFARVVDGPERPVPAVSRQLAAEAERARAHHASRGASGPDTPGEVAAVLRPIDAARAVDLLTALAANNLLHPARDRRDRAHARAAAEHAGGLLGQGSAWHTHLATDWPRVRGRNPVTRHTVDGLAAGTGSHFTVALLQVAVD
ncbi:hypothetical protein SAMN06297387_111124 [Streptomyces zhaozhouensis]|uniref:Uncharacterized protein n=1 Tax=Streptomyces zhaozhouensis TaxID=1300267 RepID=A0A286DY39_9ACTN|nr:hypothetical protein [Streptomyces zhaozhouensis]SOD63575.1 hypothetical protein SAMN06297387_111124 [Streptomyces zhaozhouensis]